MYISANGPRGISQHASCGPSSSAQTALPRTPSRRMMKAASTLGFAMEWPMIELQSINSLLTGPTCDMITRIEKNSVNSFSQEFEFRMWKDLLESGQSQRLVVKWSTNCNQEIREPLWSTAVLQFQLPKALLYFLCLISKGFHLLIRPSSNYYYYLS